MNRDLAPLQGGPLSPQSYQYKMIQTVPSLIVPSHQQQGQEAAQHSEQIINQRAAAGWEFYTAAYPHGPQPAHVTYTPVAERMFPLIGKKIPLILLAAPGIKAVGQWSRKSSAHRSPAARGVGR